VSGGNGILRGVSLYLSAVCLHICLARLHDRLPSFGASISSRWRVPFWALLLLGGRTVPLFFLWRAVRPVAVPSGRAAMRQRGDFIVVGRTAALRRAGGGGRGPATPFYRWRRNWANVTAAGVVADGAARRRRQSAAFDAERAGLGSGVRQAANNVFLPVPHNCSAAPSRSTLLVLSSFG